MKKIIALILAVLMLAVCLTACGSTQQSTTSTEPAEAEKTQGASKDPIEIVLWHTLTDHHQEALRNIIDGFNASQDEYVVVEQQQPYSEYDAKLLQSVSTGTGPDLTTMYPSTGINYMTDGYLQSFSPFLDDPEIGIPDFKDQLVTGLYNETTQWGNEDIYFFPTVFTGEVLFYNQTMFDKLGLSAPTTWDELEECAKAIHDEYGIAGFGTDSITDTFQDWVMQDGSAYIDIDNKSVAIDRDISLKWLNWFKQGCDEGYFRLVGEDYYFSNPFGSQAVGMYVGSSAGVDYVYAAVPTEGDGAFEVGCCPIPQGDNKYIASWGSSYVCLSRDEEHARGAYLFLRYMTEPDQLTYWASAIGSVPAYKASIEDSRYQEYAQTNIAAKALIDEADYVNYLPSIYGADTVRTEIDKMVQETALGVNDAESAFDAFVTAANAALNDY